MPPIVPESAPTRLLAGDTWKFTLPQGATPASEGYTCTVYLVGPAGAQVAASVSGGRWLVDATPTLTTEWTPGPYAWSAVAARSGERYTIASGRVQVAANPAASPGDSRSHAEKMLAAIEAVLEGRITADVESYQVQGRALTKIPARELQTLRAIYAAEVAASRTGAMRAGVEVVFRSPYE